MSRLRTLGVLGVGSLLLISGGCASANRLRTPAPETDLPTPWIEQGEGEGEPLSIGAWPEDLTDAELEMLGLDSFDSSGRPRGPGLGEKLGRFFPNLNLNKLDRFRGAEPAPAVVLEEEQKPVRGRLFGRLAQVFRPGPKPDPMTGLDPFSNDLAVAGTGVADRVPGPIDPRSQRMVRAEPDSAPVQAPSPTTESVAPGQYRSPVVADPLPIRRYSARSSIRSRNVNRKEEIPTLPVSLTLQTIADNPPLKPNAGETSRPEPNERLTSLETEHQDYLTPTHSTSPSTSTPKPTPARSQWAAEGLEYAPSDAGPITSKDAEVEIFVPRSSFEPSRQEEESLVLAPPPLPIPDPPADTDVDVDVNAHDEVRVRADIPALAGRPRIRPSEDSTGRPSAEPSPVAFPNTYREDLDEPTEEKPIDPFSRVEPRPKAGLLGRSRLLQKVFNRDTNSKDENIHKSNFDVNTILGTGRDVER